MSIRELYITINLLVLYCYMAYQSDKTGYIGFQTEAYPPMASAPPPPYSIQGPYWDPCGAYTAILEDSWRFFCGQMSQDWIFQKQEKFLRVETRKSDKYRVKGERVIKLRRISTISSTGIRLSGELVSKNKPGFDKGSTMENLKYQLFGIEPIKELPNIVAKSVKLIEQPGLNTSVYTFVEKYSWPMSNREYLNVEQMKVLSNQYY